MNNEETIEAKLLRYFRDKTIELQAQARQVIADHNGLRGNHRENIHKNYLANMLPARFRVGNGMIYDSYGNRSREADIVLWDAHNYPSIPAHGHSTFFAESVGAVLEVKSTWSTEEFTDIKGKCRSLAALRPIPEATVDDRLTYLEEFAKGLEERFMRSLAQGSLSLQGHAHVMQAMPIRMAAIIFTGGEKFTAQSLTNEEIETVDTDWPDVMVFLSAGKVIKKGFPELGRVAQNLRRYSGTRPHFGHMPRLEFLNVKEDALLVFTSALLELLRKQTVQAEAPFYLERYINQSLMQLSSQNLETENRVEYPITREASEARGWLPSFGGSRRGLL